MNAIPIEWIYEQIDKHPGRHASSWDYLLKLWDHYILSLQSPDLVSTVADDDYVRLHKNIREAERFWKDA